MALKRTGLYRFSFEYNYWRLKGLAYSNGTAVWPLNLEATDDLFRGSCINSVNLHLSLLSSSISAF